MFSREFKRGTREGEIQSVSWYMRPATDSEEDQHFLTAMCYVSVFPTRPYPFPPEDRKVIQRLPQIHPWRSSWGRPGDLALVAIDARTQKQIGAIWCRLFPVSLDFIPGFLHPTVPILSLAVEPQARHRGIGKALLSELKHLTHQQGYRALSLGVNVENSAHLLYENVGFQEQHAKTDPGIIHMVVDISNAENII